MKNDIVQIPHPENGNIVELILHGIRGIKFPSKRMIFSKVLNRYINCYTLGHIKLDTYIKESDEIEKCILEELNYALTSDLRYAADDEFEVGMKTLKEANPGAYVSFDIVKGVSIKY